MGTNSDCFEAKAGRHQGMALSPFPFVTVMEATSREFRDFLPLALLYTDA